jgi:hypothetical protein
MAEVTYVSVTWTAGDILTEAKLDNMTANDRAVDAMNNGIEMAERSSPSTPGANKLHLYCKDKGGIPTLYVINDAGTDYELSESQPAFIFTVPGSLYTTTSATPILIAHRALTITKAYAAVKTAPTGASLIVDLNKAGTSIWSGDQSKRLTIAASGYTDTETSFTTTALAEEDQLTLDIDQVGSTVTGSDLTVVLKCK